jgi:hypothetical protein
MTENTSALEVPLMTENTSALVGGAAAPAMHKRWVQVVRTFVGSNAAKGDVIELAGNFAAELAAANKVVFVQPPAPTAVAAPAAPAQDAAPALDTAPPPAPAPRRGRQSKES